GQIIQLFIDSVPKRLETMKRELAGSQFEQIRKQAHALKSSGANLGLKRFAYFCEILEEMIDPNMNREAEEILGKLEEEFESVRAILLRNQSHLRGGA